MQLIIDQRARLHSGQFVNEVVPKSQIVIHHTVGSGNPFNTVNSWNTDAQGRVGTAIVIAGREDNTRAYRDGQVYETFPLDCWAWSVNANVPNRILIEKRVIAIEICNYGQLSFQNGKYYALNGRLEIPANQVIDLGWVWRGSRFYHAYTDAQLDSLSLLLKDLCSKYNIPKKYNNLFQIDSKAIKGDRGIWGHCNFRLDKSDVAPQPKIIQLLKSL